MRTKGGAYIYGGLGLFEIGGRDGDGFPFYFGIAVDILDNSQILLVSSEAQDFGAESFVLGGGGWRDGRGAELDLLHFFLFRWVRAGERFEIRIQLRHRFAVVLRTARALKRELRFDDFSARKKAQICNSFSTSLR